MTSQLTTETNGRGSGGSHRVECSCRVPKHEQAVWEPDVLVVAPDVLDSQVAHGLCQRRGILQLLHLRTPEDDQTYRGAAGSSTVLLS